MLNKRWRSWKRQKERERETMQCTFPTRILASSESVGASGVLCRTKNTQRNCLYFTSFRFFLLWFRTSFMIWRQQWNRGFVTIRTKWTQSLISCAAIINFLSFLLLWSICVCVCVRPVHPLFVYITCVTDCFWVIWFKLSRNLSLKERISFDCFQPELLLFSTYGVLTLYSSCLRSNSWFQLIFQMP